MIALSHEEAAGLLYENKTRLTRPIKPQPEDSGNGWFEWGYKRQGAPKASAPGACIWHGNTNEATVRRSAPIDDYAPFQPGMIVGIQERWAYKDELPGRRGLVTAAPYPIWYAADYCTPDAAAESMGLNWRGPASMPRWACRTQLHITAVRASRLGFVSEDDAIAEGWPWHAFRHTYRLLPATPDLATTGFGDVIPSPLGWFKQAWERRRGAWQPATWVWIYEFEVEQK